MTITDRIHREQRFHDAQARTRARTFTAEPHRLRFRDAEYLDHESWVRPAIERLGAVAGKTVLDLGCGHAMAAVVLARRGAKVAACDLSGDYVSEAQARARANESDVQCLQADGHRLPFASASFSAIWGHAVLHHLDISIAARELFRVLKPNGVAVLCEPWSGNPLIQWARRWMPYSGKGRTSDEEPLTPHHIRQLQAIFPSVRAEGYQILGAFRRAVKDPRMSRPLDCIDRRICSLWPGFKRFGRYVVVTLRRDSGQLVVTNRDS